MSTSTPKAKETPRYVCQGKREYVTDPETGKVYDMGRKPCGKSLDATIANGLKDAKPGPNRLTLTCPCPKQMTFQVMQVVPGEVKPESIDFTKLKEVDPKLATG